MLENHRFSTSLANTANVAASKTIGMTTLQKTLISTALTAALGAGIYEASQAANARAEVRNLQQRHAQQIQQLTRERDDLATNLVALRQDNERLNRNSAEVLKLRGEVARLRASATSANAAPSSQNDTKRPQGIEMREGAWKNLVDGGELLKIKQGLHLSPEQEAAIEENFGRRKQDTDFTNYAKYEAELKALLTPEQLQLYEQFREDQTRPNAYTAISSAAESVEFLNRQLSLSREQQDKAFHALAECKEASQDLPIQQLDADSRDQFRLKRELEALKGVLTAEQFAIYQSYIDQELEVSKAHAAEP